MRIVHLAAGCDTCIKQLMYILHVWGVVKHVENLVVVKISAALNFDFRCDRCPQWVSTTGVHTSTVAWCLEWAI